MSGNEEEKMKNKESVPDRSLEEIIVALERQKIEGNDIILGGTLKAIPDALFYLKQQLGKGKPITGKKYHITIDGKCPRCNFMVNSKMNFCPTCGEKLPNDYKELVHFDECDCPLTWEELKGMIGKPVWIECEEMGYWYIVDDFEINGGAEYMISMPFNQWWKEDHDKRRFQAFRKERAA